ncbi:Transposable element tcb1 transposase [Caligus rogercresseyi]|uniref:Transposable element tcb1 transposase n=1 Tax=Caligus rogercresseyi TaxID=217165 RepID=A0A7T8HHT6_CALRO|nr:Transposable element tcb1 transposase [Caligus rogercresseyi]
MEQTWRDTVIELLFAGHRTAATIKLLKYPRRTVYDITKKWEESGMSKRKEHKPRSDRICKPIFVAGLKANPGRPCPSSPEAWGPPVVFPWMDSVASGTPYTFQQNSAPAHKARIVQSWLKKNVPTFWDFNTWPPTAPT